MTIEGRLTATPYQVLQAHCQNLLQQPEPDTSTILDVTSNLAVTWRWDTYTHGEFYIDMPSPRLLDANTLVHLAQIAMPCTLKYQGVLIIDQRRNRLKLVRTGLKPIINDVMEALELLLMQHDVLEALLIEGPTRSLRYI